MDALETSTLTAPTTPSERLLDRRSEPSPAPIKQPRPGRSILWLILFAVVYVVATVSYFAVYGVVLGATNPDLTQDPARIEELIAQHVTTPGALVGMYSAQFILLMPLIALASQFRNQPWAETLAFKKFDPRTLVNWLALLCMFLGAQTVLDYLFPIDSGEFLRSISGTHHVPLVLILVIAAPLLEEALFRGYLFRAWRHSGLGLSGTLIATSVLFTLLHAGQYHWLMMIYLFVFSVLLGVAREKSGTLWIPIALHSANNAISAVLVVFLGLI